MFVSARSKTIAILALFLALGFPCISQTASPTPAAKSTPKPVEPLILRANVYNKKGNLVSELPRDNFRIFIDNVPAAIVDFHEDDELVSVGIIFDASGSVGYPHLSDR